MNTDLRKKAKNDFEKHFLELINNSAFCKNHGNVRKHRDIKLVTTEEKDLFSIRTKLSRNIIFSENVLAIEIRKIQILMNKSVYLGLSILELRV